MSTIVDAPQITAADRFGLTLFLATVIHGIVILGVTFSRDLGGSGNPPSLEVILVETATTEAPLKAKNIAQFNQLASGSTAIENRPTSPFTAPNPDLAVGIAPTSLQTAIAEQPEQTVQPVLAQRRAREKQYADRNQQRDDPRKAWRTPVEQTQMHIAKLSAELAQDENSYTKRPRVNYIDTLSAKTAIEAEFVKKWVEKVERVGNLNYPDEARRKRLSGALILNVLINSDGKVVDVQVGESSGQQILDDAAIRIVELASPFSLFPEEMSETYDQLMITRTWIFHSDARLITK